MFFTFYCIFFFLVVALKHIKHIYKHTALHVTRFPQGLKESQATFPPSCKINKVTPRREAIWTGTHSRAQVEPGVTDQHEDLTLGLSLRLSVHLPSAELRHYLECQAAPGEPAVTQTLPASPSTLH